MRFRAGVRRSMRTRARRRTSKRRVAWAPESEFGHGIIPDGVIRTNEAAVTLRATVHRAATRVAILAACGLAAALLAGRAVWARGAPHAAAPRRAAGAAWAQGPPRAAVPPGGGPAAGGARPEAPFELVDPKVLRVCSDP